MQLHWQLLLRQFSVLATLCLSAVVCVAQRARPEQQEAQYRVLEGQPAGMRLAQLNTDPKLALQSLYSTNEFSTLSFVLSRESQYFQLDTSTSVLTVASSIDREAIVRMFLENRAEAKNAHGVHCAAPNGSQSVYSQLECRFSLLVGVRSGSSVRWLTVSVLILDMNDNAPSWANARSLNISVPEQVPPGYCARLPSAVDQDYQANGTVHYSVVAGRAAVSPPFGLRVGPGEDLCLRVDSALDRESRDFYQLTVVAKDGGLPALSSTVLLNVHIADDNDNAPGFNHSHETVRVSEAATPLTVVYTGAAFDLDVSDRARLRYAVASVQDSYCQEAFSMQADSGLLLVAGPLDRETRSACHLLVSVSDGKFTGEQSLTVNFDDVNDNAPRIDIIQLPDASRGSQNADSSVPTFEIVEHSASSRMVVHVEVTDADDAVDNNNLIACSLEPNEDFRLEQHRNESRGSVTYTLSSVKIFDREQRSQYELSIWCRDYGEPPLTSRKNVTVLIADINDHAPQFSQAQYTERVHENSDNYIALYVHAVDRDVGENARVQYSLDRSSLPRDVQLEVDRDSGEVRVLSRLDRERHGPNVTFAVLARDSGSPKRSASVPVTLLIADVNDHAPRFSAQQYRFELKEDAPAHWLLGKVLALDADAESPNNDVQYTIQRQVPHSNSKSQITADSEAFVISDDGSIVLVGSLDYERVQSYTLYIVASDKVLDQQAQSAFVSVQIEVKDVNDNRPRWQFPSEKVKSINVSCHEAVGKVVAQLQAQDDDSDENAHLLYSISHLSAGNQLQRDDYFVVNDITGQLSVSKTLPCPSTGGWSDVLLFKLVVNVSDRGATSLFAVSVLDIWLRNMPAQDSASSSAGRPSRADSGLQFSLTDQSVIVVLCAVLATLLTAVVLVIVAACYKLHKPRADDAESDAEPDAGGFRARRVRRQKADWDSQSLGSEKLFGPPAPPDPPSWGNFSTLPPRPPRLRESESPCSLWKEVEVMQQTDGAAEQPPPVANVASCAPRPVSSTLGRRKAQTARLNGSHALLFNQSPGQRFSPFSLRVQQGKSPVAKCSVPSVASSGRSSHTDLAGATQAVNMSRSLVETDTKVSETVYEAQSFKPGQQLNSVNQTSTFV